MKKDAYYFSHDSNARNDERILSIRADYDWEGYGWYFGIVEMLRDSKDYTLSKNVAMLKQGLSIHKDLFDSFFNKCFELGLFTEEQGRFYSESLMNRMAKIDEKSLKRAEAGRKGGNAKAMLKQNLAIKGKETKGKETKGKIYTPPSIEEVIIYFTTSGYKEEIAKKAFNYYSVADWKDSKGKQVKNWKQKMQGVWFKDENKAIQKQVSYPKVGANGEYIK